MKDGIDYFVKKVNEPLAKVMVLIANRYPEPTRENCQHPNSILLLDTRDEFFECWETNSRKPLFEALWRVLIVKYEHSQNYRNMMDWLILKLKNWKPLNPSRQMPTWKGGKCQ